MRLRCALLAALALSVGTVVIGAQPSAVVFYHPFEDQAAAGIAVKPDVEVVDGPVEFVAGKRGNGMLAGDGKAYLIFDAANIPMPAGTLEFWFKPLNWDGIATDTFHVFVETDQDEDGHWFLVYKYFAAQNAAFIWENGKSIFQRKISGWQGWVHFAVTWSPAGCRLYFNGVPSAVTLPDSPPAGYQGKMFVGDRPWQFKRDEQTIIDELYIYDRALELEEISWAFENAATRAAGADVPAGLVPTKVYARILPSVGKIVAEVKHCLAGRGLVDRVTGTARLLGPTALPPVPLTIDDATSAATLSFDTLDEGDYTLRVEFKDAAGKVVDSAEDAFFCPANEWLGNSIGIPDTPPAPWTRVTADAAVFSCWGRTYELAKSGLPKAIRSGGRQLLARPAVLEASTGTRAVSWTVDEPQLIDVSDMAAQYRGRWRSELGECAWQATAEFDGMFKYSFTLTPVPGARLNRLELRFPLRPECARLANCLMTDGNCIGATPEGDGTVVKAAGARQWWLGNEDVGFAAFCESDEAWDRIDREDGFRIERRPDSVDVVWSFIDGSVTLDKPWTFTFGMTATPVKDISGLRGRPSRVLPMNPWLLETKRNYSAAGLIDSMKNEMIRNDRLGRFLVFWGGGEWATYNPTYGRGDLYRQGMELFAAEGLAPMTYMMPREIHENVPEWRFWSEEWALGRKTGWTNDVWDSTTCVRSWVDYLVAFRMHLVRTYGFAGFYTDNSMPCAGRNAHAGFGYVRDGRVRPTFNYFGLREVFKRLYIALKLDGAEAAKPTMVMSHISDSLPVAFLGFMDNRLDGEQYLVPVRKERKSYHDVVPFAKWRAMNLSANIGSRAVFLPEYHSDDTADPAMTRQLLGLLLLHDMIDVWFHSNATFHTATVHSMWRLQDAFGVEDAQLLPYWQNASVIGGQTATLKATAYRKPAGGALIVIVNVANERTTTDLSISWAKLQSPGALAVVDAETNSAVVVDGGALNLEIAPREYRILWCK